MGAGKTAWGTGEETAGVQGRRFVKDADDNVNKTDSHLNLCHEFEL
jgi:hypothetical protein